MINVKNEWKDKESVSTLMSKINKRSINCWLRNLCKTNKWQVKENSGGNQALVINAEGKKIVKNAAAGSLSLDSFSFPDIYFELQEMKKVLNITSPVKTSFLKKGLYGYLAILVKV